MKVTTDKNCCGKWKCVVLSSIILILERWYYGGWDDFRKERLKSRLRNCFTISPLVRKSFTTGADVDFSVKVYVKFLKMALLVYGKTKLTVNSHFLYSFNVSWFFAVVLPAWIWIGIANIKLKKFLDVIKNQFYYEFIIFVQSRT